MIFKQGHTVIAEFSSGISFLENIDHLEADIVFLDLILPKMNGIEVLRAMKDAVNNFKIVILSGVTQGNAISTALKEGAVDFISKPVTNDKLTDIFNKFSSEYTFPSIEELSEIGVGCEIISQFLTELQAHSTSTITELIQNQSVSILEYYTKNKPDMFIVDLNKLKIKPSPELWGTYTEEEIFEELIKIPTDLKFELSFMHSEDFISNLFNQSIETLASKKKVLQLLELVNPERLGLPPIPSVSDSDASNLGRAASTFNELDESLGISLFAIGMRGPEVIIHQNPDMLDEGEVMKNSIFYYTLVGDDEEGFQEGLFGPLPVTSSKASLSALVYPFLKKSNSDNTNEKLILCLYYSANADRIVSDYNRINSIIKSRLTTVDYFQEIDKIIVRNILDDVINYLLEI